MSELVEVSPGRFRFVRPSHPAARSDLPAPMVKTDQLPRALEQVDGSMHESKSGFRARGRELGLREVGDAPLEKPAPRQSTPQERRQWIGEAVARHRRGERPRQGP